MFDVFPTVRWSNFLKVQSLSWAQYAYSLYGFMLNKPMFHWQEVSEEASVLTPSRLDGDKDVRSTSPIPSSVSMHTCVLAEVRDIVKVPEVVLVFPR